MVSEIGQSSASGARLQGRNLQKDLDARFPGKQARMWENIYASRTRARSRDPDYRPGHNKEPRHTFASRCFGDRNTSSDSDSVEDTHVSDSWASDTFDIQGELSDADSWPMFEEYAQAMSDITEKTTLVGDPAGEEEEVVQVVRAVPGGSKCDPMLLSDSDNEEEPTPVPEEPAPARNLREYLKLVPKAWMSAIDAEELAAVGNLYETNRTEDELIVACGVLMPDLYTPDGIKIVLAEHAHEVREAIQDYFLNKRGMSEVALLQLGYSKGHSIAQLIEYGYLSVNA